MTDEELRGPELAREALLALTAQPTRPLGAALRHFSPLRGRLRARDLVAGAEAAVRLDREPPERMEPLLAGALLAVADQAPEVEVGRGEDVRDLADALVRRDLPLPLRRAIAAVGGEIGVPLPELLDPKSPEEGPLLLASLSVRLAELERGDPEPWLDFYAGLPEDTRPLMLASLLSAFETDPGGMPSTPARALGPLYAVETDAGIRAQLVESLAQRPDPESAGVLGEWCNLARDRDERRAVRGALHRLEEAGFAVPRSSTARTEAWMSACDGAGAYVMGLGFRPAVGAPTTLVFHIDLRAGLVGASRVGEPAEALARRFGADAGRPVAPLSPARAVVRVRQALSRTRALGRLVPEDFTAEMEPWLDRVSTLRSAEPPAPSAAPIPREQALHRARTLFDEPAFEGWLHAPDRPQAQIDPDALETEIDGPQVRERVAELLGHQAEVYDRAGQPLEAAACAVTAQQVRSRGVTASPLGSSFLRRSRGRLTALALGLGGLPTGTFRPELRDRLEARREGFSRGRPPRAADLLQLDLAETIRERLEAAADELPPVERPPGSVFAEAALAIAEVAVERSRPRQGRRRRHLHTRADLDAVNSAATEVFAALGFDERRSPRLAQASTEAAGRFGDVFCEGFCRVGCPDRLDDPVPDLFFADEHPAPADLAEAFEPGDFGVDDLDIGDLDVGYLGVGDLGVDDFAVGDLGAGATPAGAFFGLGAEGDIDDLDLGFELDADELEDDSADDSADDFAAELAEEFREEEPDETEDLLETAEAIHHGLDELDLAETEVATAELEHFADELGDTGAEGFAGDPRAELSRLARALIRELAPAAPPPLPSADPDTRSAMERFQRAAPELSPVLVMRLMARAPRPGALIRLLLAAQAPASVDDLTTLLEGFQALWNHTPRPDLDGRTPEESLRAAHRSAPPTRSAGSKAKKRRRSRRRKGHRRGR